MAWRGAAGREPDLAQARFFARLQGSGRQEELKLDDFVVQVKTGAQATRTHLWITMANPGEAQVEAVMRLPVPPGRRSRARCCTWARTRSRARSWRAIARGRSTAVSLAALRGKGELAERVAKVAAMLIAPATESPAVLAWWIVERHLRSGPPIPGACILAANLLREANQPHEAGRILSEAGGVDLVATTAEFRRWSSGPDVARLTELATRK